MSSEITIIQKRFEGCIIAGAIGDAWGSAYENLTDKNEDNTTFYLGKKPAVSSIWTITDDTQLTLATCEAMAESLPLSPESLAIKFVDYYKKKKLTGLGASTLKALQELSFGAHWSQAGRTGEYAAGNGAAMRIAPLAFQKSFSRSEIRDFCRITHRNDEAFAAALAVVLSIRAIIDEEWTADINLLQLLIDQLPDSLTRDRLIEINNLNPGSIKEAGTLGTNAYAPNSIPFAIFAASQLKTMSIENIFSEVIAAGGDTDTNASIAGQIAGSFLTIDNIPENLLNKLKGTGSYDWIKSVVSKTSLRIYDSAS